MSMRQLILSETRSLILAHGTIRLTLKVGAYQKHKLGIAV